MEDDVTDDRLVAAYIKIRAAKAEVKREFDASLKVLDDQMTRVGAELLRRLHERKSKQTATAVGTAFISETMSVTIADEDLFGSFCLQEQDTGFYQKRVKVEHLRAYMKDHEGKLPPGLNVFRELNINVRAASKKGEIGGAEDDSGSSK
jgi:hypothetical protein